MLHDCYDDCLSFLDEQLGRLLEEMRAQGLLEHTLVIITSDHGEAFGSHGLFGHKSSVYLDQTWVPLVILAPDAPAGRVVPYPVSLRDLSETVVEQLGLSVGAPFPGRSLAEYWKLAPGQEPPRTSAAFSEQVDPATFGPRPRDGPARTDFRMSLFAQGRHYIRDGSGGEHLYDVRADPLEQRDLADSAAERPALTAFRRALLGVLTENPGARPVEDTYLGPYRARLKDQVADSARSRSLIVYK
jgi:arylsulfatase A-like enzyme